MTGYVNPFVLPGRWYRGNTHTHTTFSDGVLTVEQRCEAYRAGGYDFLVITDHDQVVDPSGFSRDGFLAIPGAELHPPCPDHPEPYHIVAVNIRDPIDGRNMDANGVIRAIRDQGGLAVVAHPYWSGLTFIDLQRLEGYVGLEVYNATTDWCIGKGSSEPHWDDHLDRIGPTLGLATDDAHTEAVDVFRGWIMVKADRLTADAVTQAIRQGAFYSSQGPVFHDIRIERAGGTARIVVESSPVRSIIFVGCRSTGRHVHADDSDPITRAEYRPAGSEKYVRVVLIDEAARKAWSNPLWLSDLAVSAS